MVSGKRGSCTDVATESRRVGRESALPSSRANCRTFPACLLRQDVLTSFRRLGDGYARQHPGHYPTEKGSLWFGGGPALDQVRRRFGLSLRCWPANSAIIIAELVLCSQSFRTSCFQAMTAYASAIYHEQAGGREHSRNLFFSASWSVYVPCSPRILCVPCRISKTILDWIWRQLPLGSMTAVSATMAWQL